MNYKEVIEAKYNREAWQQLLHDIFLNKVQFYNSTSEVKVNSRLAKSALYIGRISLSDGESLGIYEVELADKVDIERNKRGIRDMLTKDWKDMGHAGAFMFCYRKNESVLRFSYVSETWGFNKKGDYEKLSTNTKRYTYLLGEGRGCRTAIEQFNALKDSKQSLSDVTAAFSVEALTKQFYKDLFDWYQWAVDPASGVYFPNNTSTEDDDREDIETKIIRMITRIMFVWFIKQKGLVPNKIFDVDFLDTILKDFDPESKVVGNYYNAILQNLFFATLNRAIEDEQGNKRRFATNVKKDIKTLYRYPEMFKISEDEVIKLFSEVPFLNGGLFECLDKTKTIDGVEQAYNYDGFSRNDNKFADGRYRNRAVVPNILFFDEEKGLISILSRYNFTIEENSPEEQQVALDPELLGKVFENLLGAYNPETRETARNQSGSFYTPREIVNYMVDESLISYLGNTAFVRSLFSPEFSYDKTKADDYKTISDKLKVIKILDPACGSGAFPMGLLNRMIDILSHISPQENIYDLKLSIIENCIYGSDIQSIAAQITKLRFFISLICNCEKDANKPNYGIPTLPNLETKFVAANSLIAKKRQACHSLFENPEIEPTKQALTEIRHEHFAAKTANRKSTLRQKDKELREKLARLLAEDNDFAPDDAKQLADWNPYDQNAVADFFDPEWMFGVSDGFDIVIGNPPILRGRDIKRYGYNWANLWLINTHNGIRGKLERIHIEDYPAVKAHLDHYWDRISKRADKGDTPYNLRNCAYLEDFSKPKIVYMEIQTDNPKEGYPFPCFSFDERNSIALNTAYIMCSDTVDVRYILGILNSSVGRMIARLYVTQLQEHQFRMLAQYLVKFPIVKGPVNVQNEIIECVQENLVQKNKEQEDRINNMVYQLYGFDKMEADYIKNIL